MFYFDAHSPMVVMPQVDLPPPPAYFDGGERRSAGSLLVKRELEDLSFVESVHGITNLNKGDKTPELPHHHPSDKDCDPSPRPSKTPASNNYLNPLVVGCQPKKVGGVRLTTLLLCLIHLFSLGGIIAIWVFATITVNTTLESKIENTAASLTVFIHVGFVIVILAQLVFLHRACHRLRRERYQHFHPGQFPPQQHSRSSLDSLAALAPWNQAQPRLPLYRTAPPQSGIATRDVEANPIAISPPPAYGRMRECTR